jgi:putative hydrolase of HD superfamily
LIQILGFVDEVEKLKMIYRQNMTIDGTRQENSAEHSWHLALMALLLTDFASEGTLDLLKVVKMLLIHDLVEIDTGDTFLYDAEKNKSKNDRELQTAKRLFGLLPEALGSDLFALWNEFEERLTPEARYAASLDAYQPLANHLLSNGKGIIKHRIRTQMVIESKKHIAEGSPMLWDVAQDVIQKSEDQGLYLK